MEDYEEEKKDARLNTANDLLSDAAATMSNVTESDVLRYGLIPRPSLQELSNSRVRIHGYDGRRPTASVV
ncbi:hypothetical protein M9458_045096, partial [Cirrhinus mrigala]